jgi:hypothetical protein
VLRFSASTGLLLLTASRLAAQATVTGVVREDSSKVGVPGVEVVIVALDRRTLTDSAGRYTLSNLSHGIHNLLVRSIGYQPILLKAYLVTDDTLEIDLSIRKSAFELAPLEVTASAVPVGLEGFEERRRSGFGRFFDWTQLRKEEHRRTSDLFYGIPGVRVQYDQQMRPYLVGTRKNCRMQLLFNGARVSWNVVDAMPISNLDAIEIYRSGTEAPVEYGGLGSMCGTVIFWSRRR